MVTKAAIAAMTQGIDPDFYIRVQTDPFDFMLRTKATGQTKLMLGGVQIQDTTRYYIARDGHEMKKVSPPTKGAEIGQYKRANKLTDTFFQLCHV